MVIYPWPIQIEEERIGHRVFLEDWAVEQNAQAHAREVIGGALAGRCFYCSRQITLPCVQWLADGPTMIYMHPACVVKFSTGVLRDVHEIEGRCDTTETEREEE